MEVLLLSTFENVWEAEECAMKAALACVYFLAKEEIPIGSRTDRTGGGGGGGGRGRGHYPPKSKPSKSARFTPFHDRYTKIQSNAT